MGGDEVGGCEEGRRKNKAVNGAPCHCSYGKKHRMNWKNERRVQKGAEGKEKTSPTTCLPASLLFLSLPFLLAGRVQGRGVGVLPGRVQRQTCFVSRESVV